MSTNLASFTGSSNLSSSIAFLLNLSVIVGALTSVAAARGGNSLLFVNTRSTRSRPPWYVVSSRIVSESNKYMSSPRIVRMASISSCTLLMRIGRVEVAPFNGTAVRKHMFEPHCRVQARHIHVVHIAVYDAESEELNATSKV